MTSTLNRAVRPEYPPTGMCDNDACRQTIYQHWQTQCGQCRMWFCSQHLHITSTPQHYLCGKCGGRYPKSRLAP